MVRRSGKRRYLLGQEFICSQVLGKASLSRSILVYELESLPPFSQENGLRTIFLVTGQHVAFPPTFSNLCNSGM